MATSSGASTTATDARHFPAYGPIEALLGLLLFVVILERVTPNVVAVTGELFPGIPGATVRTALAVLLWFVVLVTAIDQVRRQLAALGFTTHDQVRAGRGPGPSRELALGYLVLLVLGWLVAAYTFETAIATAVGLVSVISAQDVAALDVPALVTMVVFFVAYGLTTRALDRLVIGGMRVALQD